MDFYYSFIIHSWKLFVIKKIDQKNYEKVQTYFWWDVRNDFYKLGYYDF